jgi:hypothetical protein
VRWIQYRREVVNRQPCSGTDAAALIRALGASGRPDEAIRSSRAYTLTVREDYGLDPDPAVAASVAALLAAGVTERAVPSPVRLPAH